jgi:hypothetical protein
MRKFRNAILDVFCCAPGRVGGEPLVGSVEMGSSSWMSSSRSESESFADNSSALVVRFKGEEDMPHQGAYPAAVSA